MTENKTQVVQVTNISHNVSGDQIKHFLEYIGRVREVNIFPDCESMEPNLTKVAYARFDNSEHVEIALHLNNTVMVDRALIILPYPDETIPDEIKALRVAAPINCVAGMLPPTKEWPSNVVNMVCGTGTSQTIQTLDAKLVELGLPQYPALPAKTDPSKIEEIRRTIYVSNLDPSVNAEQLVQFFSQAGEVMFVRMAGDENLPSRNAYIEFTNQRSVPTALAYNGVQLNNRHLKVAHSLNAITNKPQTKGQEQLTKEIDEALKKYKDVEHLIHAAAGNNAKTSSSSSSSKRPRSRSRSRERRRHKSKERRRSRERRRSPSPRKSSRRSSRDRKRRSRSRSRDRKRSRSRDRSRRSRSRDRKRSSPSKKPERTRDRDRRRRSRSKDRRRSRSRDRKNRHRSTSRDKDRKHRRDEKNKEAESKDRSDVKVKRDYDAEEKDMESVDGNKEENNTKNEVSVEENHINGENGDGGKSDSEQSEENVVETPADQSMEKKTSDPMAELEQKVVSDIMDDSVEMDTTDDAN